jgi:uroporphyrinogen-III synthase
MNMDRPLLGRSVVTTRDERGRLDALLEELGADVVHVPLIEIVDPPDGGAELERALAGLASADWLVVTSKHGARRCAPAAATAPRVRLAAVGTATARVLAAGAGRDVDVVPARQTAADLLAAMPQPSSDGERIVLAQADRADDRLADGLTRLGYVVDAVTAYVTRLREPSAEERRLALAADAVAFASGSAAVAWATAIGCDLPAVTVAIGPTTAAVARESGLHITHVAADQTVEGLADGVVRALRTSA